MCQAKNFRAVYLKSHSSIVKSDLSFPSAISHCNVDIKHADSSGNDVHLNLNVVNMVLYLQFRKLKIRKKLHHVELI